MDFNAALKLQTEVLKGLDDLRKRIAGQFEHKLELEVNGDFNWSAFLQHVKETSETGHSFSIVVDPGDSEYEKSFGFDGDGADRIVSAKIDGKNIL